MKAMTKARKTEIKNKLSAVESRVQQLVLDGIKKGELMWQKPWAGGTGIMPKNHISGVTYKGANLYLSFVAQSEGYKHNEWVTFNQVVAKLGLTKVRQGKFYWFEDKDGKKYDGKILKPREDGEKQKACPVEYWTINYRERETGKYFTKKQFDEAIKKGTHTKEDFRTWWSLGRVHYVYNIEQTVLPLPKIKKSKFRTTGAEKIVDGVIKGYNKAPKVNIIDSDRAFYSPSQDSVTCPTPAQHKTKFNGTGQFHYASTMFHELVHSTGHKDRLAREGVVNLNMFGDHSYAKEEIVAESGSCMLMQFHNLDCSSAVKNTQAYLKGWAKSLKKDPTMITEALRESSRAVMHILGA